MQKDGEGGGGGGRCLSNHPYQSLSREPIPSTTVTASLSGIIVLSAEAANLEKVVTHFLKESVMPDHIGVTTQHLSILSGNGRPHILFCATFTELDNASSSSLWHAEAANLEKVVTHFLKGGVMPDQIGVTTQHLSILSGNGRPHILFCATFTELDNASSSSLWHAEAANLEKVVTHFLKGGVMPDQIGVITPYEGQRAHILTAMARNGTLRQELYNKIEVASVDSFQGREKDFIILSCVRSNEHQVTCTLLWGKP